MSHGIQDEKNQIMQTNIWLTLKWNDFQFHWDPSDYGGITSVRVPQDKVWVPDVVLFNNADGNYEVSFRSNVNVESNGDVMWVPPAIYKSSCRIDVEYFPFDEQTCMLIFGTLFSTIFTDFTVNKAVKSMNQTSDLRGVTFQV
uniref:Neurotransmitter-gated ion-channel ligand-binding domain-containing protein n=1 Tax=Parascaris equorum TaxID=6256 RepID=A0A914RXJ7_PAREQ